MIEQEKFIKGLNCCRRVDGQTCNECPYWCNSAACRIFLMDDMIEWIKEQPDIAMCKYCKCWYPNDNNNYGYCSKFCIRHKWNWFCAYGERRTDDA